MSPRLVIGFLVVAVVLTGVAVLLLRPAPAPDVASRRLVEVESPRITAIEVLPAEGPPVRVVRDGAAWRMSPRTEGGVSWTIEPSVMSGALRLATTMEGRPVVAARDAGDPAVATLVLADASGELWRLEIGSRTLGGTRRVTVIDPAGSARSFAVAAEDARSLVDPGPPAWRSPEVLAEALADARQIGLETASSRVVFQRGPAGWQIIEPGIAPADAERLGGVVKALGAVAVDDFLDAEPGRQPIDLPGEAGVRAWVDHGALGDGRARVGLELGGAASLGTTRLFARVSRSVADQSAPGGRGAQGGWADRGRSVVVVNADPLASVPMDASAYVRPVVLAEPARDIGGMAVFDAGTGEPRATATRGLDGWSMARGSGAATPADPIDADAIAGLIRLLCDDRAERTFLPSSAGREGARLIARVQVRSVGGSPLAEVEVLARAGADGAPAMLLVGRDDALWAWALPGREAVADWLTAMAR